MGARDMKKTGFAILLGVAIGLMCSGVMWGATGHAQETLEYSCSAQVYRAFEKYRIDRFTKATGIQVDLFIASSDTALNRLKNDFCDIASSAKKLDRSYLEQGYVETTFCRDPFAVIVNTKCRVDNISTKQLQGIFTGAISNWKELGGPEQGILLVVPGKNTAAYRNFEQQVVTRGEIVYDLMTYVSTEVIDVVKQFPGAISFICQGAISDETGIQKMKIEGLLPGDKDYPYFQEFSFVTKGKPVGAAKAFIDFAQSKEGRQIITDRNMIPVLP
jgi:phosphate transport system substrate-binding protein